MLKGKQAFSSFAVKDLEASRKFYAQVLGLDVKDVPGMKGIFQLDLPGTKVMIYPKPDHAAATYTVLNVIVDDVERTVNALVERGVKFEVYKDGPAKTNEKGISGGAGGPRMAWFKDPSGNILSVLQER